MVLGSTRARSIDGESLESDVVAAGPTLEEWRAERGAIHWEGGVDLFGGFPGFETRGGRLLGVQLRLSDHYLLVEEGRPHGFGLPLTWLLGADLFAPGRAERSDGTLRLRYEDGAQVHTFQARVRGSLLAPRGSRRAEQMLAVLLGLGVHSAGEPLPAPPDIAVSWDDAARFEGENVIWSGQATALIGIGGERAACDVWLTTRSIIWGSSAGQGILRLPLEAVIEAIPAELSDRARTPALYVACADEQGGRYELPFIFDRHSPAQRNISERGAFLVGLRSRRVSMGSVAPLPQPWRGELAPRLPQQTAMTDADGGATERHAPSSRGRRPAPAGRFRPRPVPADTDRPGRWERAMAEWTGWANWPEPADDAAPLPTPSQRQHPATDGAVTRPALTPREQPARGILLHWPGLGRAERAPAASSPAPDDATAPLTPSAETAAVVTPPEAAATPVEAVVAPAGGELTPAEVAETAVVLEQSAQTEPGEAWPIPSAFLGTTRIEPSDEAALAPAAAEAAPEAAAALAPESSEVSSVPETRDAASVLSEATDGPRAALRRYEEGVLRVVTEALRAIEERLSGAQEIMPVATPPTPAERSAALDALDALVAAGELPAAQAEIHRALLVAAGEVGPRLRSLLELRDAGHLSNLDLDRKRRLLIVPIAELLAR